MQIIFLALFVFNLSLKSTFAAEGACSKSSLVKQTENLAELCRQDCKSPDNEKAAQFLNQEAFEVGNFSKPETVRWGKYGQVIEEQFGVKAFANKENGEGGKYQCVELIHRYLNQRFVAPEKKAQGMGNADVVSKNTVHFYRGKTFFDPVTQKKFELSYLENSCSKSAPHVGGIISLALSQYGHVGIIKEVRKIDENTLVLSLFEQHGIMKLKPGQSAPRTLVTLKKDKFGKWRGEKVIGWINFAIAE